MNDRILYYVTCDRQGGSFGMNRTLTAKEWLDQTLEWHDQDDVWEEDNEREEFEEKWTNEIESGNEQKFIDYISSVWELDIEPIFPVEDGFTNDQLKTIEEMDSGKAVTVMDSHGYIFRCEKDQVFSDHNRAWDWNFVQVSFWRNLDALNGEELDFEQDGFDHPDGVSSQGIPAGDVDGQLSDMAFYDKNGEEFIPLDKYPTKDNL